MTPELQMACVWMSTMSYMDTWQLRGPEICSSLLCATDHFGGQKQKLHVYSACQPSVFIKAEKD